MIEGVIHTRAVEPFAKTQNRYIDLTRRNSPRSSSDLHTITSINCVFGSAISNALFPNLTCVACSYAYAYFINSNSLHAVPMNVSPNGIPDASSMTGSAGPGVTSSGVKPSGTERTRINWHAQETEGSNVPVTRG